METTPDRLEDVDTEDLDEDVPLAKDFHIESTSMPPPDLQSTMSEVDRLSASTSSGGGLSQILPIRHSSSPGHPFERSSIVSRGHHFV